jgi:hypothetical protein
VVVVGDDGGAETGEPLVPCTTFASPVSEYFVCPGLLAHDAALGDCALRGATLAAIGSAEEDAFVAAGAIPVVSADLWLGGARDDAHVWSWGDGTVFWRGGPDGMVESGAYSHWKPGEPNNASTTSPDPERCLALTPAGDWNDRACELTIPYLCERAL